MPTPINMRVGVDWDNDGYINFGVNPLVDNPNEITTAPLISGATLYYSDVTGVLQRENLRSETPPVLDFLQAFTVGAGRFSWGFKEGYGDSSRINATATNSTALVPASMMFGVTPSTTNYVSISMKVKQNEGSAAMSVTPGGRYTFAGTTAEGTVSTDTTGTVKALVIGSWVEVTLQFTVNPGGNSVMRLVPFLQFTYAATNGQSFSFKDLYVQIRTGSHITFPHNYNNGGANYAHEDISQYVLDADWTLGNADRREKIPSNGTAMFVLDNQSGRFLPNNTSSPIYGKMLPRRRVKVQMFNGSDWVDMWHGYIKSFKIVDGNPLEKRVRLECEQSIYNTGAESVIFDGDKEDALTVVESDFGEAVGRLLYKNPIQNADLPIAWRLGASSLGHDTYLSFDEPLIEVHTAGVGTPTLTNSAHNKYKYIGTEWTDMDFPTALRAIVNSEYGWLFYNRDGSLSGFDRYGWHTWAGTPVSLDMNSMVFSYVSSYGEDIINSVTVKWRDISRPTSTDLIPANFKEDDEDDEDDEVVDKFWKRKKNIAVRGDKNMKTQIERIAVWHPSQDIIDTYKPTNADGQALDLYALWSRYNAGGPVPEGVPTYDFDPEKHKVITLFGDNQTNYPPTSNPGALSHSVIKYSDTPAGVEGYMTFFPTGIPSTWRSLWRVNDAGVIRLRWPNYTYFSGDTFTVNPIMMRALVNINNGEQTLTMRDADSIMKYGGVFGHEIGNSLYVDEEYAGCVAQQILADYEDTGVGIASFKMVTDDRSSAKFTKMMSMTVGTMVELSEYFLGLSAADHIIIQESHNVSNGVWEVEYTVVDVSHYATGQELADIANGL